MSGMKTMQKALMGMLLLAGSIEGVWAQQGVRENFRSLKEQAWEYYEAGRYSQMEAWALRLEKLAEGALASERLFLADALTTLGVARDGLSLYSLALEALHEALAIRKQVLPADHPDIATSYDNLGNVYHNMGRYAEALQAYQEALAIRKPVLPADDPDIATSYNNLGNVYHNMGRYAEALQAYQEALAIREKNLPPNHADQADSYYNVGCVRYGMGRYAEALEALQRALAIQKKSLPAYHSALRDTYKKIGQIYLTTGRSLEASSAYHEFARIQIALVKADSQVVYEDVAPARVFGPRYGTLPGYGTEGDVVDARIAVAQDALGRLQQVIGSHAGALQAYQKALTIRKKVLPADHPDIAMSYNNLGNVYDDMARYAEALQAYQEALAIRKRALPADHPDIATSYNNLGVAYHHMARHAEALQALNQAVALLDRHGHAPELRYQAYWRRAEVLWKEGRREQAVKDLKDAMDAIEWLRGQVVGEELHRAAYFEERVYPFELMVSWQAELGDMAEVLTAMERSRARTLLEQMETHGMDLLAGMPQAEAARLRRTEQESQGRAAALQRQRELLPRRKDLSAAERKQQYEKLEAQLRQAQKDHFLARAAVRNVSPAYRLAIGQDRKPITLEKLQQYVSGQNALLLEYFVGTEGGYVLVIAAGAEPRLEKITANDEQAQALGIESGPLTAQRLQDLLNNETHTGLLDRLRRSATADEAKQTALALAALWELLIPQQERAAMLEGKYKRLIVLPDGPLARLPFETLVAEPDDDPKYLLDVGPPIEYAPSATILVNLAEREAKPDRAALQPVLTVGDCRYGQPSKMPSEDVLAQLTPRRRYRSAHGQLNPLPYSAWEIGWVGQVFGAQDTQVASLAKEMATEANVRNKMAGRRVVHLACHGLVDQAYGNLFGALALTPGPKRDDPSNDGFLTLAEIYELDLKGCELAILSACDTNVGPEQRGEGVWALSRGFLVAGSRRVVASNWLVDDEAAASLVSYFCSILANAEKEDKTPDYAEALHHAKRWVRSKEKWKSPYYWGTFVLIGPD